MVAVSVFFLLLFLAAAGAALVAGLALAGRVRQDVAGMRGEVGAIRSEAQKYEQEIRKAMSAFAAEAEERRAAAAESQTSDDAALTSQLSAYGAELGGFKSALQALERENGSLKEDLAAMRKGFPAFSNDINRVIQEAFRRRLPPPERKPASVAAKPPEKKAPAAADLIIAITLPNAGQTVPWCLPIPE